MAPKRPVPTGPTGAMAKGSAFRTSSSKKRKAESGENSAPAIPRTRPAPKSDNGEGKQKALPSRSVSTTAKKASNDSVKAPVTKPSQVRLAVTNGKQKATTLFVEQSSKASAIAAEKMKSATGKQDASIEMPTKADSTFDSFRIIVGSYERLLYGYNVTFAGEKKVTPKIDTIFSFAAHTSCISAVAAASADSKWLATGAGDETVRVWDLRKKKEVGGLVGHNGTILSLSFPARTYLLSADSSGLINLYRTRDWCLLKTLKGHTGKVNACVAHPSGKLALSVGQDGMLRMWDLMRGKGAGAVRLNLGQEEGTKTFKEEPLDVKWNQSGSRFVVMGRTEVVVYKTDMSRVASLLVRRDDPKSKFGCVEWQGGDVLLTGNESGVVGVYRLLESSIRGPVATLSGHANRVRAVRAIKLKHDEKDMVVVTTVSSDGKIRIFDITTVLTSDLKEEETMTAVELQPIGVQDTGGARLTCLDVVGGIGPNASSAAEGFEDGDDDEEEGESLDSDVDVSEEGEDGTLDKAEMEELNKLLDLVEEARRQGVEVEGLSEFEDAGSSDDGDEDDGEYDDEDEDEIQDEDEEELESEDEEEGEDDE